MAIKLIVFLLKMSILDTKPHVWNSWEPRAVRNFMKSILIYVKHLQKAVNAMGSVLNVKMFLQLSGRLSEVAPSSSSNLQFNFFNRDST